MVDIDKAFNPETKSVHAFYQSPGVGFYIPLYQREYSWDRDNIDQLLDDLSRGVDNLQENAKDEIRFLGTIIAVKVVDKRTIYPIDPQGLPSSIETIIDGQQRLSTIALFCTLLYKHILQLEKKIKPKDEEEIALAAELQEACIFWKEKLKDVFSLDLKRGSPQLKPKIIRGNKDQWTKDGNYETSYLSEVAIHIAEFIEFISSEEHKLPPPDRNTRAGKNLSRIDSWLRRNVILAHVDQSSEFLPAWEIIFTTGEDNIWQYERESLAKLVLLKEIEDKRSMGYVACALVQLFAVCHYLLDRCCFTIIQPMNEDWAFDMFQSLNATGTPLTAIETFKPTVVNITDAEPGFQYKDSDAEKSFERIDALFADTNSASQKNKLANEFLTSFALAASGDKLASHFSKQRRWLEDTFNRFKHYTDKRNFIHFFGNYADFYKNVWIEYKGQNDLPLPLISSHPDAEMVSLLILYLKESNHKMAITVLACFYSDVLDGKENSISKFVKATKLIARFYTIWRSAEGNAGLDNVYRSFFRGEGNNVTANHWIVNRSISINVLLEYLDSKLEEKGLLDQEAWLRKAKNYLSYNKARPVCKFALFASADETIPDPNSPGLMKKGMPGTTRYLTLRKWNSGDLKTIEHIAPQKPSQEEKKVWDSQIYADEKNELYHRIGNLTLLPQNVNISASNKGWTEKYLYYQHLSEKDQEKQQELANRAKKNGVMLTQDTIKLLQSASYNDHIKTLVSIGYELGWNASHVEKRGERILTITWGKITNWLNI